MMPPAIGPTIHTHQLDQSFVINAGPNHRAGFMAAPVRLAPTKMSIVIMRPIVKPAVSRERAPLVDGGAEHRPHEEEGQEGLDHDGFAEREAGCDGGDAAVGRVEGRHGQDVLQGGRGRDRAQ